MTSHPTSSANAARQPLSQPEMAELIQLVAADRDREAFMQLFDHFAPRIKGFLRRRGAPDALAEDLAQDVMFTLWQRSAQYDPRQASVSTWVFTIARNRQIDVIRRENRPELDPDDPAVRPADTAPPDDAFTTAQSAERVRAALKDLPPEQAKLIEISFFEDVSHSVIAERLDLPLGTVKSRLRLALQKLRAALHGERGDDA